MLGNASACARSAINDVRGYKYHHGCMPALPICLLYKRLLLSKYRSLTQSAMYDMTDDSKIMLRRTCRLANSPEPIRAPILRSQSTLAEDVTTVPGESSQPFHHRSTGPVSERWLQQPLLPRLTRRPYSTHRYFQQRMTGDGATQDVAPVPTPVPQSNPRQTSQPESQLSDGQDLCANSNGRAFVEVHDTALHEYRECLINLASKSNDRSPHHDALVASRTAHEPLALSESLSPGSTVENTEEEHEAAVELCLSSHRLSSATRCNDALPYDRVYECCEERPSKRICTMARKHPEDLGVVDAAAVAFENQNEYNSVRPRGDTRRDLDSSASHTEDDHFSHTNIQPNILGEPASAETYLEWSETYGILPQFPLLNSMPEPVRSVVQPLASSSTPFAPAEKYVGEERTRAITSDQDLEKEPEPGCADIRLSQVTKSKGAFLRLHEIWCPVPGSWDEAVALSEDTLKRTAQ
jgi:hypothetical protein